MPFIAIGPKVEPGSVSRVPVTGLDFFPTIAELAGYKNPLPQSIDGGSLLPVLRNGGTGAVKRSKPFLIFHQAVARKAQSAILAGDYKLVKTWSTNTLELFDLSQDVGEANDLSKSKPDETKKLHTMMVDFFEEIDAETSKTTNKKNQR